MNITKPEIKMTEQMNARPHPGPLPQERENRRHPSGGADALCSDTRFATTEPDAAIATKPNKFFSDAAMLTLSSGERVGVRVGVGLIMLFLLSATLNAHAQYSIDWFTIDGGGGTSTGGPMIGVNYSVSGTIGQPDAGGPMTNGQYSVTGGFWVLPVAVQTPGAPTLHITNAAPGFATISWTPATPGFVLQETVSLSPANWTNSLSGATNPIIVTVTLPTKYYRLFKP